MVSRFVATVRVALTLPPHIEIPANVERIERIPYSLLPDASIARDCLITLAWRTRDVDAYQAAGTGECVIWCKPAGEAPDQTGRHSIAKWVESVGGGVLA